MAPPLGKPDASVVRDEETGEPSYFVAIIEDISARKAAEEALRASEEFNRRIVESSSDCIKILDLEGRLLYISERGQELLGIEDAGPYINNSWIELWPGDGQRSARAAIEQAKASGFGVFQAYGPTPQGQAKWWDTVITPMSDAQGQVWRLLAISRDISESKQAEESLKSALEDVRRLKDRLQEENVYLREEAKLERHFGEIVGRTDAVRRVLRKIEQVAATDATVLITGETGTGKELVARAIHRESPRHDRPLVKVNCAALSPTLCESELFGHEKGVHRRRRPGRSGGSNWPTAPPSSSTRSASYPWSFSRSCCAFFRTASSSAWAARITLGRTYESCGDEPRPVAGCASASLPSRSLLPPERVPDRCAAAAPTPRGHPAPGRTLRGHLLQKDREGDNLSGALHAGDAVQLPLARQREGAGECDRAGRHYNHGHRPTNLEHHGDVARHSAAQAE
jgi:PAS domain S-box-containing protein